MRSFTGDDPDNPGTTTIFLDAGNIHRQGQRKCDSSESPFRSLSPAARRQQVGHPPSQNSKRQKHEAGYPTAFIPTATS